MLCTSVMSTYCAYVARSFCISMSMDRVMGSRMSSGSSLTDDARLLRPPPAAVPAVAAAAPPTPPSPARPPCPGDARNLAVRFYRIHRHVNTHIKIYKTKNKNV